MADVEGFPYFEVQVTHEGTVHDAAEATALATFVAQRPVTDLLMLAHGWNNDMTEARDLYRRLLRALRQPLDGGGNPGVGGRSFVVMAVLWPSKRFTDPTLIAGGAAGAVGIITAADLRAQIGDLRAIFPDPAARAALDEAEALVDELEHSPTAQGQFVERIRSLVAPVANNPEDAPPEFFSLPPREVLEALSQPLTPTNPPTMVGAGGAANLLDDALGAAGNVLGNAVSGIMSGASQALNFSTYYAMKERSGVVGRGGALTVLRQARAARPDLKLHLIGHSFGGRLATAAATAATEPPPLPIASLTLLQAAFSHHGFASLYDGTNDGFFRAMVTRGAVTGPVLITCTANDIAVGVWYARASLLFDQAAADLGDENSRYGGIGRNGARKTPEAIDAELLDTNGVYQFAAGRLHNLKTATFIQDHGDVTGPQVAHAILAAVAST